MKVGESSTKIGGRQNYRISQSEGLRGYTVGLGIEYENALSEVVRTVVRKKLPIKIPAKKVAPWLLRGSDCGAKNLFGPIGLVGLKNRSLASGA
jgi:hypothetical protein